MLEIIRDIIRYFARWFHHTQCKSNCGNAACDCDNEAESSSSGSSVQANVSHDETHHHHHQHGGVAISQTASTHS